MWNSIRTLPVTLWNNTTWFRRAIIALWFVLSAFAFAHGDSILGAMCLVFGLMDCLWVLDWKARADKKKTAAPTIDYSTHISLNAEDTDEQFRKVKRLADLRSLRYSPRD